MKYMVLVLSLVLHVITLYGIEDDLAAYGSFEEPTSIVVEQPTPTGAAPLPIDLPFFGTINLYPFTDEKTKQSGFRVAMPDVGKQLALGPFVISNGAFALVDGKLSYGADATLFGAGAHVRLKDVSQPETLVKNGKQEESRTKITLGIDFLTGKLPTIELIPGMKFVANSAELVLEKTKPVILNINATVALGGKQRQLIMTITVGKQSTDLLAKIPDVPLTTLMPDVQATAVANNSISELTIAIKNFTSKEAPPKGSKQIEMTSTVTLGGLTVQGEIHTQLVKNRPITTMEFVGKPGWRLSDAVPAFAGTLFDSFILHDLHFIIASDTYVDTERNITFRKGLNFSAGTKLSGSLASVGKCAGKEGADIILSGYIPMNPLDTVFKAQIPSGIQANNNLTIGPLSLEIAGNPLPMFSLITSFAFVPAKSNTPLTFASRISVGATDGIAAGTFIGFWRDPLGIKGIQIGNVALEAGINYAIFAATGVPTEAGVAGSLRLGDHQIAVAGKMDFVHQDRFVMSGSLDKLALADTLDVFHIPASALPAIEMRNLDIYISPEDTTIGEFVYQQGLKLSAEFMVPGFTAVGYMRIESSGAEMRGYCSPLSFGPLKIKRSQAELSNERQVTQATLAAAQNAAQQAVVAVAKANEASRTAAAALELTNTPETSKQAAATAQQAASAQVQLNKAVAERERVYDSVNGPIMSLMLTSAQQAILVSGRIEIADILAQDSFLSISKDGMNFSFTSALGTAQYQGKPLLQATVAGKSAGSLLHPEFAVTLNFEQTVARYLQNEVNAQLAKAQKQIEDSINQALRNVGSLDQTMLDADRQIADAQKKVDAAQAEVDKINGAIKESDDKLQAAQDTVNTLQKQIDDFNAQISKAKTDLAALPVSQQIISPLVGKIIAWGTQMVAVQAAKSVADNTLKGVQSISRNTLLASRATAQATLAIAKQFLETVAKGVTKGTLTTARTIGTGVLTAARISALGAVQGGRFVANKLLTAVDVQKLQYTGTLDELASGKLGNVTCQARILDMPQAINFSLDIKDAPGSLKSCAQQLVNKIVSLTR